MNLTSPAVGIKGVAAFDLGPHAAIVNINISYLKVM